MEKTLKESLQRNVVVGLAHNDLHGGNLLVDSQGFPHKSFAVLCG